MSLESGIAASGGVNLSPIEHLVAASRRESFEHYRAEMETAMLFPAKRANRRYAMQEAIAARIPGALYLELGVWRGTGSNLFAKLLAPHGETIHGFDSFEGLEEDWSGRHTSRAKGDFSLGGVLPKVRENVNLIKGWVQDTLPPFLAETDGAVAFVHMDMDTYTPTRFALDALAPRLVPGSVILFDELYGYPGWRHHEQKALEETLPVESYRFISFSEEAAAIQMV